MRTEIQRLAQFILDNYPPAQKWTDVEGYCEWYVGKGYVITVIDDDDKIAAMCAIRPVERPGLGCLPFYCNEYGACLHIDLLIDKTTHPLFACLLAHAFEMRFGRREWITLFRKHEEKMHVYRYDKFWKSLSRFKRAQKVEERKHESTIPAIST
jgi:hypothetical protein